MPFVGTLHPEPVILDPKNVVLFGSYTLWRYAQKHDLHPGVFMLRPFVHEPPWHPFLLNSADATILPLDAIPQAIKDTDPDRFIRPVSDNKEIAGQVMSSAELRALAHKVLAVPAADLPQGSLRHDTDLMLTQPARIQKEWRIWVVNDKIITYSMYKDGHRVTYRPEIDEDAQTFANTLIAANPGYAPAYVLDICRTLERLAMLETNCINAAEFYAADLAALVNDLHQS